MNLTWLVQYLYFSRQHCAVKKMHPQHSTEGLVEMYELNTPALLFSFVFIASDTYQLHLAMQKRNTALCSLALFPTDSVPRLTRHLLAKGVFISEGPFSASGSF